MKIRKILPLSVIAVSLLAPAVAFSANFDDSVKEATTEIDKAKAVNYEWRDSRKMLKKAAKLNKEGKTKKADKLVAAAKHQGIVAVKQAEQQKDVTGARN